jgi:hypothetical protein
VRFRRLPPLPNPAGDYHFAVGTAGSTGLVLQTVLMPLLLADGPSRMGRIWWRGTEPSSRNPSPTNN